MVQSYLYDLLLKWLLNHSADKISVQELQQVAQQPILLDARAYREYRVSHLPGAIHVGFTSFDINSLPEVAGSKNIVVYCSVGYRSEKIARRLVRHGHANVQNLYGGIFEWKNSGHAVEDSQGLTENVHAYNKLWGFWLNNGTKVYE